jgi:spermidine/putrescine transport system substrate-binding protein
MPPSVLEAFRREFGVTVKVLVYDAQEEAVASLRAGGRYDVIVLDSRLLPGLVGDGLLAEIDYRNVPNSKNISANFRDLVSDPGNRHNIPFNWGLTGLVVRSDLVGEGPLGWADLWQPRFRGKVGLWMGADREVLSLALKALGYSANSENPEELDRAVSKLLELKPHVLTLEDYDLTSSAALMASGRAVVTMGYVRDYRLGREKNKAIRFVFPKEGALLWGDTFVVPRNSPNKYTAELFLNFLLRPDIAASIANENSNAVPNDAALPLIAPSIRNDPVIFPPPEVLRRAEVLLPLTPAGTALYAAAWKRFQAGGP